MRGGYGSSDHGTLADRVARRSGASPPDAGAGSPVEDGPPFVAPRSPARHCLVDGQASLLVEWCRTERGWEGRVVSVLWMDAVGWVTVARWLPASDITPVP